MKPVAKQQCERGIMLVGAEVLLQRNELQFAVFTRTQIVLVPVQHLGVQAGQCGIGFLPGCARLQARRELVVCAAALPGAGRTDGRINIGSRREK